MQWEGNFIMSSRSSSYIQSPKFKIAHKKIIEIFHIRFIEIHTKVDTLVDSGS